MSLKVIKKVLVGIGLASLLFMQDSSSSEPCPRHICPPALEETLAEVDIDPEERVKYAVMIRGDDEDRHVANFSMAYQTLLENGFHPWNIVILAKDGRSTFYHPVDAIATRATAITVLENMGMTVDSNDLFFLYLNDHGKRDADFPDEQIIKFEIGNESINELELEHLLRNIDPGQGVLLFGFCHSGAFAHRLGQLENYVAVSSALPDETSNASTHDSFDGYFMQAFSHRLAGRSDYDGDGRTSVEEAFQYATRHHSKTILGEQTPQLIPEYDADLIFIDE